MKSKTLKFASAVLSASLLINPIATLIGENKNIAEANYINTYKLNKNNINKIFEKEKVKKEEINNFVEIYEKENKNKIRYQTRVWSKIPRQAIKNAVKFLVTHHNIIPGKTLREAIKKYGGKFVAAVETVEAETTIVLAKHFMNYGIPEKYAYPVADFIIKYIV